MISTQEASSRRFGKLHVLALPHPFALLLYPLTLLGLVLLHERLDAEASLIGQPVLLHLPLDVTLGQSTILFRILDFHDGKVLGNALLLRDPLQAAGDIKAIRTI